MKNKKFFLSFCDSRMYRTASRVRKQAEAMNIYDEIIVANESDLDDDFYNRFKDQLVFGSRGFGYWCWKPQMILQTLQKLNNGDVIQYTDAGCHLNKNGLERLESYFQMSQDSNNGILAFEAKTPEPPLAYDGRRLLDLVEYKWTKGDLFDYFGVRNNSKITHSQSMGATVIFIRKSSESVNFVQKWLDVIDFDFSLIDNSESNSPNLNEFIEHRHDQSIFSLLCKINNVKTVSAYEYWYPLKSNHLMPNWKELRAFPIHAKRDKDLGWMHTFITFMQRVLNKIRLPKKINNY